MPEEGSIQVNFGRPMPLFPLDSVSLLPQQILSLHIFEERYKQMVADAITGSKQFALGVFKGDRWKQEYHGSPPVRPVVCIAQIVRHEQLPDGRSNLIVQGICRAQILSEERANDERLYRRVSLQPIGLPYGDDVKLYGMRERFRELLTEGPLIQLKAGEWVLQRLNNEDIPNSALLELVSFTLVTDPERRYELLAEPDAAVRAEIVEDELLGLQRLIEQASAQHPETWPKGCSWN